jgi:hypothetical protein
MVISFFQKNGCLDVEAVKAGVYKFLIGPANVSINQYLVLYVGESYSMLARCGDHIYSLFKDPSYMGLTQEMIDSDELKLVIEVQEKVIIAEGITTHDRDIILREHEDAVLKELRPISQKSTSDDVRPDRVENVRNMLNTSFGFSY